MTLVTSASEILVKRILGEFVSLRHQVGNSPESCEDGIQRPLDEDCGDEPINTILNICQAQPQPQPQH